ncbi:molybdopterin molybdotransferase MoeA [Lichenicoccus sp.]|uniref:molybdopterin molybdotransferase MoeA n=1 Tax=Lichenicoccus sp. TaxID=2781899 RepID=UPI003D105773
MLSVEDARARILEPLTPLSAEFVALDFAWGRVTARPVAARLSNPPADISAMDGYAVRACDTGPGARLAIIGAAPAGHPFTGAMSTGESVRVFTGSVMPAGSDAVLIQENASRDGDRLTVHEAVAAGRHIRRAGQDFARADIVLPAGRRLGARDIGVVAAANHAWVACHRRPIVALLATGDEVAFPGEPIPPGGIANSNTPMLAAVIRAAGGEALVLPPVADNIAAIAGSIDGLRCDMLVTIGGASVGDHDLVQAALAEHGLAVDFWKIAMRPGKPLMHGRLQRDTPVLGLPGNPVSALVCALQFLLPAIARMTGDRAEILERDSAVLAAPVGGNDQRADHLRASLTRDTAGGYVVRAFDRQDSGMLRRLADSEALILRPPHAPALPEGARVEIIRLDRFGL